MDNCQTLLFRVEASAAIGTGHVMRCLALAQAWQTSGGKAIFAVATELGRLQQRVRDEGIAIHLLSVALGSIEDGVKTIALAKQLGANWLVVDGYDFDARYQQQIKAAGLKLLFIDDYGHATHYYADLVLNQNVCADERLYANREPDTQLLLGTRYVLLRQEFLSWQTWQRQIPKIAKKVLVTLGGGDPDNVTLKVINALQQVEVQALEVVVVVGGSNPHYEQLKTVAQQSQVSISLQQNVTNMPELMAWADVAIAAGGSTNWELAFMGLPSIIVVLADNQRAIAQKLAELGAAVSLGWHEQVSPEQIAASIAQICLSKRLRYNIYQSSQNLANAKGQLKVLKILSSKQ